MKFLRPRKDKPLFFDLRVYGRDTTLLDVKAMPVTKWHDTMNDLEHKGALPKKTPKQNILEMMNKGL